jgi:hypothetical protein
MATATKKPAMKLPPKKKTLARPTRTGKKTAVTMRVDAEGAIKLSAIPVSDIKYMGDEPNWAKQDKYSESARRSHMARSFNWYNYSCDRKQARSFFEDYCSTVPELKHVKLMFKRLPDSAFGLTTGWLARMILSGFTLQEGEDRYIQQQLASLEKRLLIEKEEVVVAAPGAVLVKKETIQDRLAEKFSETMGEVEGAIDEFIATGTAFSAFKLLSAQNIAVQYVVKVPELIQPRIVEMTTVLAGTDAQLTEAYKFMGKREVKALIKFYETIINDAMAYKTSKIATRAKPVRKPVAPERQVRGLKYLKVFAELGLKSINPTEILGMNELWIYNTKTRKIGHFVVAMHGDMAVGQLSVKGSAIIGFDEIKSVTKTLRKPAVQLAEFKACTKPLLRKFMDTVKSVETRLKGRISPETILLRALK